MKPSSAALFNTRYEEHYDVDNDIWSKLITLSISTATVSKDFPTSSTELLPVSSVSSKKASEMSPVLDEI